MSVDHAGLAGGASTDPAGGNDFTPQADGAYQQADDQSQVYVGGFAEDH